MSEALITITATNIGELQKKLDQLDKLLKEIEDFRLKIEVNK